MTPPVHPPPVPSAGWASKGFMAVIFNGEGELDQGSLVSTEDNTPKRAGSESKHELSEASVDDDGDETMGEAAHDGGQEPSESKSFGWGRDSNEANETTNKKFKILSVGIIKSSAVCYVCQVENNRYTNPIVQKVAPNITHSGVMIETRYKGEVKFQTIVDLIESEFKPYVCVRHYLQSSHQDIWDDDTQRITMTRRPSYDTMSKPWKLTKMDGADVPFRLAVWRETQPEKMETAHKDWVERIVLGMKLSQRGNLKFKHITGNCQHAAAFAMNKAKLDALADNPGLMDAGTARPPNYIFRLFAGRTYDFKKEIRKSAKPPTPSKKSSTPASPRTIADYGASPLPSYKIKELLESLTAEDTGLDLRDRKRRFHKGYHNKCFLGNGFCEW
eukprot:CAMPEP_0170169508 /NCGR_PEP_ID=MMETSP0040_2-20121228/2431_1 /TAXON_ID=641309 /ORGANISM="Lotharella oceanica, Strain CCMP622" /LENGTH=387 /DNA_ID=CAMNT_0010408303 /DNA_START=40 /DNA_END=1200 /DNA_ORIENTATION=-